MRKFVLLFYLLFQFLFGFSQTPGLILKSASAPGKAVLDPNGDGYVSALTNGIQKGFTIPPDDDVVQSEIPYVPLVKPDPTGDILKGPTDGFIDILGSDATGNNAVLTYNDGTNLLFRFRLGGYAANSKAYSILIDSDQKFGFTGENADPNALNGNVGFEVEIVLRTNFSVDVYNVDGTLSGTLSASHSYDSFSQKSIAVTQGSGDADYFYDFYIPLSDLAALGISTNTPLRFVSTTAISPHATIGANNIADIGGVTTGSNIDAIFTALIEGQTPTTTSTINVAGVTDRSVCPSINSVAVANTSISGTSTEASGTAITVYVYQSNGTTLIGSGTTTTSGSTWAINVSALSPSVTLAAGQIVKATATASGKGTSYDNCDIETVINCTVSSGTNVTVNTISGAKGYTITNTFAAGTIFTWYNSDFTIAVYPDKNGSTTMIPNPVTSTAASQTITYSTQTGQTFPNGVFYFTFQEPGKCVSDYLPDCQYANAGTSTIPTITTTSIATATTSISGTCGEVASPGAIIYLYVNGVYRTQTTVINATTWTISGLNFSSDLCKIVTVSEADAGKCPSAKVSAKTIYRIANSPTINSSGCTVTPPTIISGFSTEIGATVTLYRTSPTTATLGTAVVQSDGSWSVSGLSLSDGNVLAAAVSSGTCLLPSVNSNSLTISTQTNIANYTIGFTTPIIQNSTSVSGTISGGTYPVTLKLYVDESQVGSGITISSAGSWTVSGLTSFDLALGSIVQVKLTGSGCESELSPTFAIVQCSPLLDKTISASTTIYCANSYGTVTVQNSQSNILYTPVASDGLTVIGYSALGNGSNIDLTTYQLTTNPTIIKVKASSIPVGICDNLLSGSVAFTINPLPAAPTGSSPQLFCASGSTTLANLAVTAPAGSILKWYTTASGSVSIASSTNVVDGTTYYAESENSTTGCISATRTAILVQTGAPAAPTASASQTFCTGATVNSLVATLSGPGTISWFAASSGGTALDGTTILIDNTTYYAQTVQNSCVSGTRIAVTAFINSVTGGAIANDQSIISGGDPAAFTVSLASTGSGTLSYQWQSSTTSSSSGFSNISGAISATYDVPAGLNTTTYYKRVTISTLNTISCTAESNVITVTVSACVNPSITVQPVNPLAVCESNGTATIQVTATGTGLSYQWYVDGTTLLTNTIPYSGVTSNTLTITNPAIGLNGKQYTVKVTGTCGSVLTSNAATLTVNANPAITVQPVSPLAVCESNGAANIQVTTTGAGLSYQWYVDGTTLLTNTAPYSGTTSNTLTITNPAIGLNGKQYTVKITGTCGSVLTSNAAILTVNSNPLITVQPVSPSAVCESNGSANIQVTASGTGLSYQWYVDGTTVLTNTTPYSGVTSNTLSIANPAIGLNGKQYTVQITGTCGSLITSNAATLTVNPTSVGGSVSGSTAVCSGSNSTTLTLSGHTGIVTKWQSSSTSDFSAGVADISSTTITHTVNNLLATTYYRAVVKSGTCAEVFSGIASISTEDNEAPLITCPATYFTSTNTACTYVGSIDAATATDNCTATGNIIITNDAPSSFLTGNTTVTWTAEDEAGNTSSCMQIVTVSDDEDPTITCPATVTSPINLDCTASGINLGSPVTTDNCTVFSVTNDHLSTTYTLGNTTVTWTVADANGNSSTCTQTVTVSNSAPTAVDDNYIVLQNTATVPTSISGNVLLNDIDPENQSLLVSSWGTPSSGALNSNSNGVFTYTPAVGFVGVVTFTYTMQDACGIENNGLVTIDIKLCVEPPSIPEVISITK